MGCPEVQGSHGIADETLDQLRAYAAAGTPCVLATVVRCEAPTSARPGDKAIITVDGHLRGWIGGSCSEPVVRREALRALGEGTARLVRIIGGSDVKQTRKSGELTIATTCPSGGSLDIFIEPHVPKPLLLVFGDTPAARTLVRMGSMAGFRTCSVHPGAREEDFTGADLVLSSLDLAAANPGPDTWAVAATMGHYDEDALEAALAYPDVHVALVASTRRAAAATTALRERGMDVKMLARIHRPATRVRGAGQEEIALLTLAEVVIRRRRRGASPVKVEPAPVQFATDSVCGMTVDVATARNVTELEGRTYYFCSAACEAEFEANPEKYLKAIQA